MFCNDETKFDASFPDVQFHIDGHQFHPFKQDRSENGGGKMVFIKEGLIAKRMSNDECEISETISFELTVSEKEWCITFGCRPPNYKNKEVLFMELNKSCNYITRKYEYILVIGDVNTDLLSDKKDNKN